MHIFDQVAAERFCVLRGDCLEVLRGLPDNSVDSVVTDPPYGLNQHDLAEVVQCLSDWIAGRPYTPKGSGFMGNEWDAWVPGPEVWREVLRVTKPGGYMLVFAGSRSFDLVSMAVRLAGWEVRDTVMWVYGSGFPKSHDVSKAIDRASPATDAAREWAGWGTALKPAHEPIVMARKPLTGTVADNVQTWGTGAINVDACRVETHGERPHGSGARESWRAMENRTDLQPHGTNVTPLSGRWPANLIHDGSDEVVRLFPVEGGARAPVRGDEPSDVAVNAYNNRNRVAGAYHGDTGSAARFFYCAKASRSDRDEGLEEMADRARTRSAQAQADAKRGIVVDKSAGSYNKARIRKNPHPTVKPTDLMRYLVRLVTPPGDIVLDPFAGSGSTGKAAMLEGFRFIGVELDSGYVDIAEARIAHARNHADPDQGAKQSSKPMENPGSPRKPRGAISVQPDLFAGSV